VNKDPVRRDRDFQLTRRAFPISLSKWSENIVDQPRFLTHLSDVFEKIPDYRLAREQIYLTIMTHLLTIVLFVLTDLQLVLTTFGRIDHFIDRSSSCLIESGNQKGSKSTRFHLIFSDPTNLDAYEDSGAGLDSAYISMEKSIQERLPDLANATISIH
jgi:hypothetical protein